MRTPTGGWTLAAPPDRERTIDEQLSDLLDQLNPHAHALHTLPDCRLSFQVLLQVNWLQSGRTDTITATTLARIAALGATLDLDLTCETCY